MKKISQMTVVSALATFITLASSRAEIIPISINVLDIYSSTLVFYNYELESGQTSDRLFEVVRNGLSPSINKVFDLGLISGSQIGQISADPTAGRITAAGRSDTVFAPVDNLKIGRVDGGSARSQGKHVVIGEFSVPDFGAPTTEIVLDITADGLDASALFFVEGLFSSQPVFDPNAFSPEAATSIWSGVSSPRSFSRIYDANDVVQFAVGIEPGTGISLSRSITSFDGQRNIDSISAVFQFSAIKSVPEPSALALFAIGLAGLGFASWRRKREQQIQTV